MKCIYIDETCHLSGDDIPIMCIGYIKVDEGSQEDLKEKIKALKLKHRTPAEIKWNTISSSRLPLYKALVDLFFESAMAFRCVLIKYKQELDHKKYNMDDPNSFYYKIVYLLLNSDTNPSDDGYKVFLDIKDSRGKGRLNKVATIFSNLYMGQSPFICFQHIESHANQFLQMVDLFIGAIGYRSRGLVGKDDASATKAALVRYIEDKLGQTLDEGTKASATKFNIFDHKPAK